MLLIDAYPKIFTETSTPFVEILLHTF